MHPPFSFPLAEKRMRRARWKRKGTESKLAHLCKFGECGSQLFCPKTCQSLRSTGGVRSLSSLVRRADNHMKPRSANRTPSASLSAAAPSVRLCSPLLRLSQPVCIWYENSHEFCPKPHRRAAAAARSRSNRKPHLAWQAALCTARAALLLQGQSMAGQGRSPCGLGGLKGGHSSVKNGPL